MSAKGIASMLTAGRLSPAVDCRGVAETRKPDAHRALAQFCLIRPGTALSTAGRQGINGATSSAVTAARRCPSPDLESVLGST